jgi:hypothetical protein
MRTRSRSASRRALAATLIAHLMLLTWAYGSWQVGLIASRAPADTPPPSYPDHTRLLVV